jgi:hypothetical protein
MRCLGDDAVALVCAPPATALFGCVGWEEGAGVAGSADRGAISGCVPCVEIVGAISGVERKPSTFFGSLQKSCVRTFADEREMWTGTADSMLTLNVLCKLCTLVLWCCRARTRAR